MTYKKLDQLLEKENSKIHNPSLKELSLEKYEIEPEIKNKMSLNNILKNIKSRTTGQFLITIRNTSPCISEG
ncbi:hypothetical protein J4399_04610 [Candidatus Woesearchaeota archaeon]|nr:hypothetical protein [Candidatus Woesearchaeota archaeon]